MAMLLPVAAGLSVAGTYAVRTLFRGENAEPKNEDEADGSDKAATEGEEAGAVPAEEKVEQEQEPSLQAEEVEPPAAAEAEQEHYSQAEQMIRDAVALYRARGYHGTIVISTKFGIYTETCSIGVQGQVSPSTDAGTPSSKADDTKAGRMFEALLARLEKRALSWDSMCGVDPVLSASATVGFAMPLIKVGWGFTTSLSITKSSLLRWARRGEKDVLTGEDTLAAQSETWGPAGALAAATESVLLDE